MKIIVKLLAIFTPFALLLAFPAMVLLLSGELFECARIHSIAARQGHGEEVLYGTAYRNTAHAFKIVNILERSPKVLALGSSRVMQFRSAFFRDPPAFYNAGGAGVPPGLWAYFEHTAKASPPEFMLLGLDQWWFHGGLLAESTSQSPHGGFTYDPGDPFALVQNNWMSVYGAWLAGKFSVADLFRRQRDTYVAVGLLAKTKSIGFLRDGSYSYGTCAQACSSCSESSANGFQDSRTRVARRDRKFTPPSIIDLDQLARLERFLDNCKARGIVVAGFLPPYAPSIHQAMLAKNGQKDFEELARALDGLFRSHGYAFLDASNAASLLAEDSEMLDGFHSSEKLDARIVIDLARKIDLSRWIDLPALEALLAESRFPCGIAIIPDRNKGQ